MPNLLIAINLGFMEFSLSFFQFIEKMTGLNVKISSETNSSAQL